MRLDQVGKRYGFRYPWVLDRVSLEIPAGRLVRFEGKNGSGKSTLLRIIAGVAEPSRGTVSGRPVTGYVPERFPPALPFPAREYLAHIGRMHGLAGPELRTRIEESLDRLGGRELGPVPLRTMSKGMAQKVAVAQAMLPGSGLLVLDEAWTGLDAAARAALDEVAGERVAAGGSVVFVDHDPARLAGADAERWRLEDAGVVRAGPVTSASDSSRTDQAGHETVIELSGWPAGSLAVIGQWPGVLSVRRDGVVVIVRAEPAAADLVLRRALTGQDGVHVIRVGPEPPDQGESLPGGVAES